MSSVHGFGACSECKDLFTACDFDNGLSAGGKVKLCD